MYSYSIPPPLVQSEFFHGQKEKIKKVFSPATSPYRVIAYTDGDQVSPGSPSSSSSSSSSSHPSHSPSPPQTEEWK